MQYYRGNRSRTLPAGEAVAALQGRLLLQHLGFEAALVLASLRGGCVKPPWRLVYGSGGFVNVGNAASEMEAELQERVSEPSGERCKPPLEPTAAAKPS